jgi:ABC-type transporter Mla subunit MlaD
MLNANRFKLGLFVLIGLVLIVGSLLLHGLGSVFEEKFELYTVFDESVQGLEIGSEVKYKGVKLGNVSEIEIFESKYIKVTMEIKPGAGQNKARMEKTKNFSMSKKKEEAYKFLQNEIKKGLSCQLTMAGITGMKIIEFDHGEDDKRLTKLDIEDVNYIPSKKGLLEGTVLSLNEALTRISQVDFKGISDELKMTLKTFRETMNSPEVHNIFKEVSLATKDLRAVMATVNNKLKSEGLSNTIKELNSALKEVKNLAHTMTQEIKSAQLAKLSKTADQTLTSTSKTIEQFKSSMTSIEKEFNATLKDVSALTKEAAKVRGDLNKAGETFAKESLEVKKTLMTTLGKLDKALDAIQTFFKMVEKDPSSLIQGKSE